MLKVILLLAAVAAATANNPVTMRPCPNGRPLPTSFTSPHCVGSRCTLRRGQVFTGVAHVASADSAHSVLTVALDARVFGVPVDLRIPPGYENACDWLVEGSCPIGVGHSFRWGLQIPVDPLYPAIPNMIITRKLKKEN